jgi:putative heme-binding domain-containing protein
MNRSTRTLVACLTASVLGPLGAAAGEPADPPSPGQVLFESYCVHCHAPGGSEGSPLDLASGRAAARSDAELATTIAGGVEATRMPPFGAALTPHEIAQLVAHVRSLQGAPYVEPEPVEAVAELRDPLAERGEALFHGAARCGECHAHGLRGGLGGPDLGDVGQRMDRPELLTAIRRPSAQITPGWETFVLVTRDGRTLRGHARKETPTSIQLLDPTGELWTTYMKADLQSVSQDPVSLMPEGLLDPLSPDDRRALLHFLIADPSGRTAGAGPH